MYLPVSYRWTTADRSGGIRTRVSGFQLNHTLRIPRGQIRGAPPLPLDILNHGDAAVEIAHHQTHQGRELVFSIMVNNYNGQGKGIREKMFRVLDELK